MILRHVVPLNGKMTARQLSEALAQLAAVDDNIIEARHTLKLARACLASVPATMRTAKLLSAITHIGEALSDLE